MKFQCTACGVCCRKKHLDTLPFDIPRAPNGDCIALGRDGLCTIYPGRPLVCRTSDLYDLYGPELDMTRLEFYIAANVKCNEMQAEAGVPEDFRIDVSLYTRGRHGRHKRSKEDDQLRSVAKEGDDVQAPADKEQ